VTIGPDYVFRVEDVEFAYRPGRPVLEGLSLNIQRGAFHAVIGPNGAGKSTLLGLLSGRLKPRSGRAIFEGRDTAAWPRREFARRVAVIPQNETSAFDFTVWDLVLMGRYPHRSAAFGVESESDRTIARESLALADLGGFEDRPVGSLSGGERRRLLAARALAQRPEVLLLDEPTTALDPLHQRRVLDLVLSLNRDRGTTSVLVTHDLSIVGSYSDRTSVLVNGRIEAEGRTEEIVTTEYLSELFRTPVGVRREAERTVLVGLIR